MFRNIFTRYKYLVNVLHFLCDKHFKKISLSKWRGEGKKKLNSKLKFIFLLCEWNVLFNFVARCTMHFNEHLSQSKVRSNRKTSNTHRKCMAHIANLESISYSRIISKMVQLECLAVAYVYACMRVCGNVRKHSYTQTSRIPSFKRLCIVYNRIWINLTKLLVKIFIMSSRIFYWGLRSSHWVNVYCVRFQFFFFPNFMYAHSSAHSICVRLLSVCLLAATETWWVLKFSRCACD